MISSPASSAFVELKNCLKVGATNSFKSAADRNRNTRVVGRMMFINPFLPRVIFFYIFLEITVSIPMINKMLFLSL